MATYLIKAKSGVLSLVASYEFGHLTRLEMDINETLNAEQVKKLPSLLPLTEEAVAALPKGKFEVEKQGAAQDKAGAWCKVYNARMPAHYRLSGKEIGQLKNVKVSEEMVTAFMDCPEWWANPKSVGNYVARQNELAAWMAVKPETVPTKNWPEEWSESYEAKLSGPELSAWWQHLRSQGLRPVKNRLGKVIKWEKGN
jgi:hypothetical protein